MTVYCVFESSRPERLQPWLRSMDPMLLVVYRSLRHLYIAMLWDQAARRVNKIAVMVVLRGVKHRVLQIIHLNVHQRKSLTK